MRRERAMERYGVAVSVLLWLAVAVAADPINVGDDPDIPEDHQGTAVSAKLGSEDAWLDYDGDLTYTKTTGVGSPLGSTMIDVNVLGAGSGVVRSRTNTTRHDPFADETLGGSCQALKPLRVTSETVGAGEAVSAALDVRFDGLLVVDEGLDVAGAYSEARVEYLAELQQYNAGTGEREVYGGQTFDGVAWVRQADTTTVTIPETHDWGAGDGPQPNSWYDNPRLTIVEITADNIDEVLQGAQKADAQDELDADRIVYYLRYEETFEVEGWTVGDTYYMYMDLLTAAGSLNGGASTADSYALSDFSNTIEYAFAVPGGDLVTILDISGTESIDAANPFGGASSAATLDAATLTWNGAFDVASDLTLAGAANTTFDTNGNDVTVAGAIDGARGIAKQGAGTLCLTGNNTYAGGVTLTGGNLEVGHEEALGTGPLVMNNAGATLTLNAEAAGAGGAAATIDNDVTAAADLHLAVSRDTELGGTIHGAGTITRDGAGVLTLSGDSSATYTGELLNTAGTLRLAGATGGDVTNSAAMRGGGSVGGDLRNASGGTLNPGDSPGITTVGGDFTNAAGATLTIELAPASATFPATAGTDYDQLQVGGAATLEAGSFVDVVALSKGYIADGDTFDAIVTGAGVTDAGATVTDNANFMTFSARVAANTYQLRADRVSYTTAARGHNAVQVARGLDALAAATGSSENGAGETLLAELDSLGPGGSFRSALGYLSPEPYDVIRRAHQQTTYNFLDLHRAYLCAVRTGRSDLLGGQRWRASEATAAAEAGAAPVTDAVDASAKPLGKVGGYVLPLGQVFWGEDGTDRTGYDGCSAGVQAGLDAWFAPRLLAGLVFRYADTRLDYGGRGGDAEIDSYRFGLYGSTQLAQRWYVNAIAGYGYHRYSADRPVRVGTLAYTARSNWDGHDLTYGGGTGYDLLRTDTLAVTPFASLHHSFLHQRGHEESDAGAACLRIHGQDTHSLPMLLGLRLSAELPGAPGLSTEISGGWRHDFLSDQDEDIRANFRTAPGTFSIRRDAAAADAAVLSATLGVELWDGGRIGGTYTANWAQGAASHQFGVVFSVAW